MKKGSNCPYCSRILVWDAYIEKWVCLQHGEVDLEVQKVKAGKYR